MQDPARRLRRVLVILAAHGEAEGRGFRQHFAVSWRTLHHLAEDVAYLNNAVGVALAVYLTIRIFSRRRNFDRGFKKGTAANPQRVKRQNPPD
jgi:hypothetical protein